MENENVGEQPLNTETQETMFEGSPFGKFANAQELKSAYENLEKEFTRKSQLLSEFKREAKNFDANQFGDTTTKFDEENQLPSVEDTLNVTDEKTVNLVDEKPYWERDDWNQQVQDFLEKNPLAKNYAEQISKTVLEDKEILASKNPLQHAWAKWLQENYKTPEQLLEDPKFLEKVKQNQKIRREIIKDYVSELNNAQKSPPMFLDGQTVGPTESSKHFPKTLEEAKEWAKKIFSN